MDDSEQPAVATGPDVPTEPNTCTRNSRISTGQGHYLDRCDAVLPSLASPPTTRFRLQTFCDPFATFVL